MKIGFFDSGLGGLSVLHLAMKRLPEEEFIYYADEEHVPYGEKTQEEIAGYVDGMIQFMLGKQVSAVVMACNTATSAAIGIMRNKYSIPIIGMEPAVKKAVDIHQEHKKRILIAATPVTVKGEKMMKLVERVDREHLVDLLALPSLVTFAERGEFDSPHVMDYLRQQLSPYNLENYSSFVLGCTHFNYFKDSLREILPKGVRFVDGNEGTVNRLKTLLFQGTSEKDQKHEKRYEKGLEGNPLKDARRIEYYYSGVKVTKQQELDRLANCLDRLEYMLSIK